MRGMIVHPIVIDEMDRWISGIEAAIAGNYEFSI
jgi:hypothetical protein